MDQQKKSQKNIYLLVCYGDQQDVSTSKVSLVSQPSMCHNNPQNSHTVKSKSTPEKSTLPQKSQRKTVASKSQRISVFSQPLTLVLVLKCTACINRSLHQKSAPLDHALTKVNVGQTYDGNPSCSWNCLCPSPTCEPQICLQVARTNQKWREKYVWWGDEWNVLQHWLYLYPSLRVCDTFAGDVEP